jgi:uncharacterized membrane protein
MLKLTRNRTPSLVVVGGVSEDRPLTRDDAPGTKAPKTSVPKAGTARPARTRRSRAAAPPPAPDSRSPWPAIPAAGTALALPPAAADDAAAPRRPADAGAAPPPGGSAPAAEADAPEAPRVSRWFRPSVVNVKTVYATYLVSLAVPPAALVGLLIAYEGAKSSPPAWLSSHYTYQLRTFWMGLALNVIAWTLFFTGVGLLLYPLIAAWVVARSVKGIARVATGEPIEDPHAFFV